MNAFYEYLMEFTKARQERLLVSWTKQAPGNYRWEDIVEDMKKKNSNAAY